MQKITFVLITCFIIGIANINAQTAKVVFKINPDNKVLAEQLKIKRKKIESFTFNAEQQIISIEYDTKKMTIEDVSNLLKKYYEVSIVNDSIVKLSSLLSNDEQEPDLPKEPIVKFNPEVDIFLNRVGEIDDGIFKNFKIFKEDEIHSRNKDLYQLIKAIHDMESLLFVTNDMRAKEKDKIIQNIDKIGQLNDLIISYATDTKCKLYFLLSEFQKEYYRNLFESYQKLRDDYN
ncbi:MAG: hypothetical protein FWC41_03380 [Firmicutes bacterium]|nr:hypothetical protein [Bacillota bacterium]